jgi:DNA polymerase-3 subunit epsilon
MKPYVLVLDFETANMAPSSACSIGIVVLEDFKVIHEECFLIRPPTDTFLFTHIHGLTYEDVKNSPTFDEIWEKGIAPWYLKSKLMVAHNIGFDQKVLHASAKHYGIEIPRIKTECTVKLARYKLAIKPANLRNVSDTLGIELNHHEALSDARASAMIYIHTLSGEKPWLGDRPSKKPPREKTGELISSLNSEKSAKLMRELLSKKAKL